MHTLPSRPTPDSEYLPIGHGTQTLLLNWPGPDSECSLRAWQTNCFRELPSFISARVSACAWDTHFLFVLLRSTDRIAPHGTFLHKMLHPHPNTAMTTSLQWMHHLSCANPAGQAIQACITLTRRETDHAAPEDSMQSLQSRAPSSLHNDQWDI